MARDFESEVRAVFGMNKKEERNVNDQKRVKMGALWGKQVNGQEMFSGEIEINNVKHRIVCWKNGYKQKPNQPDYNIYADTFVPQQREQSADPSLPPAPSTWGDS